MLVSVALIEGVLRAGWSACVPAEPAPDDMRLVGIETEPMMLHRGYVAFVFESSEWSADTVKEWTPMFRRVPA